MSQYGKWPKGSDLVTHPFPLRLDCQVWLELPPDLTRVEAERLCRHVMTLAVDVPAPGGER